MKNSRSIQVCVGIVLLAIAKTGSVNAAPVPGRWSPIHGVLEKQMNPYLDEKPVFDPFDDGSWSQGSSDEDAADDKPSSLAFASQKPYLKQEMRQDSKKNKNTFDFGVQEKPESVDKDGTTTDGGASTDGFFDEMDDWHPNNPPVTESPGPFSVPSFSHIRSQWKLPEESVKGSRDGSPTDSKKAASDDDDLLPSDDEEVEKFFDLPADKFNQAQFGLNQNGIHLIRGYHFKNPEYADDDESENAMNVDSEDEDPWGLGSIEFDDEKRPDSTFQSPLYA